MAPTTLTVLAPALEAIDHEIAAHKAALALAEAARLQLHNLAENRGTAIPHAPLAQAIEEYVRTHAGATRREVVDAAMTRVSTHSQNPRKSLQTRLGQLVVAHRLVERAGRLYPPA